MEFNNQDFQNNPGLGKLIQEARLKNSYTVEFLASLTKLKPKIIDDLEKEKFSAMTPLYIRGYLKRIGGVLNLDLPNLFSLYEKFKIKITPVVTAKPRKPWRKIVVFTPKLLTFNALFLFFIIISFYLSYQFYQIIAPPGISINSPARDITTQNSSVIFQGHAARTASLIINNQAIFLDQKGNFETSIDLHEGLNVIEVIAQNVLGKTITIERKIVKENF